MSNRFLLIAAAALLAAGCDGGLPTVEGIVTLDGQPLRDARIVFQSPDRPMAVATTDGSGHYTVMTGRQEGMAPGSYQVTISAYETRSAGDGTEAPVPQLITPRIYNQARTSGLTAEIHEGRNGIDFALQSASGSARSGH